MALTALSLWTVYDDPTDRPGRYVARRFEVDAEQALPTEDVLEHEDLHIVRRVLADLGLVPIGRSPDDDPKIVETWL